MIFQSIIKLKFIEYSFILPAFGMLFLISGCVIDPVMRNEVYKGEASGTKGTIVYAHILKIADDYKYGVETVWFVQPEGTMWKLSGLSKEPGSWKLIRRCSDGKEEKIPLIKYEWGYYDATRWPVEWTLTPLTETGESHP